jgi:hypothetical protein
MRLGVVRGGGGNGSDALRERVEVGLGRGDYDGEHIKVLAVFGSKYVFAIEEPEKVWGAVIVELAYSPGGMIAVLSLVCAIPPTTNMAGAGIHPPASWLMGKPLAPPS